MSYIQSDLDKLEQMLLRGTRTVQFSDGRSVTYESTKDLMQAIEYVRKQIEQDTGRTRLLAEFTKGVQS